MAQMIQHFSIPLLPESLNFVIEVLVGATFIATTLQFLVLCHHQEACHWLLITPCKGLVAEPLKTAVHYGFAAYAIRKPFLKEPHLCQAEPTWRSCDQLCSCLSRILFSSFVSLYVDIFAKHLGVVCKQKFLSHQLLSAMRQRYQRLVWDYTGFWEKSNLRVQEWYSRHTGYDYFVVSVQGQTFLLFILSVYIICVHVCLCMTFTKVIVWIFS